MPSADQDPKEWSGIAADYERAFVPLTSQVAGDVLRLLHLKPGARVIDVAAGTGAFSFLAARAGMYVLATDFAPGMIARLREGVAAEGLGRITTEVMDGQALTVPEDSFDAGVSILGLIFFPDINKGLSELRRVVRPGGRVAIVCWGDINRLQPHKFMMQAIMQAVPGFQPPASTPIWARMAGSESLRNEMGRAGFEDVEITVSQVSLPIESPQTFWSDFTSSAPPLTYLFQQLGPDRKAAAGRVFMELLKQERGDGSPHLSAETCLGIGRV
jgi:ubiquinone/menaquinone biosynthesis C-methylase UbiE